MAPQDPAEAHSPLPKPPLPQIYLPGPSQRTGDPCASELRPPVPRLGPGPL